MNHMLKQTSSNKPHAEIGHLKKIVFVNINKN